MPRPSAVLGLYLLWPYLLWPYLLWPYLPGLYLLRPYLLWPYLLWLYLLWLYLLRLYSYFRWLLLGTALVSEYCARFGDDYFSYWVGGVKYVSINSQYYHILCVDNPEADEMAREQAAWVEEELSASATAGAVHVVVLSHITPFMGAEDEETGHFNWKRAPREWMVRLCSQPHLPGGRATIWLCGHYHASCMARTQAGTEVVTTGAAGGVINWSKPPQATATPPRHQAIERSPPSSAALASSCVPTLCAPSPACIPRAPLPACTPRAPWPACIPCAPSACLRPLRTMACLHPAQVLATQPVFQFMECVNMPPVTCDAFNSGLRVCRVRRDRIDHRFLELNAVPPTLDEVP